MIFRSIFTAVFMILCVAAASGQSYVFGLKAGVSLGQQRWNGFSRQLLIRPHGDIFIESWNEENKVSVFAMAGYHLRGSSLRTRGWYDPNTGENYSGQTTAMEFHNAVLTLGVKQKFPFGLDNRAYYMLGVRGEYTIKTEFEGYLEYLEGTENKFLFGMSFGAGVELPFSRYVGLTLEGSVHPDFTKQIYVPPQDTGFNDPVNGTPLTIPEQNISNLTFEISIGVRFLREVIYID